jgi:bifunctional DNA-binding transcriptional regulator/antitoxin component of YhaV-PrlF toxin-antitoxin module
MSEAILKVGNKGEIYTDNALRERVGIKKGGKVKAKVSGDALVIEPVPSIEELLRTPVLTVDIAKAENLSEQAQEEEGAHG